MSPENVASMRSRIVFCIEESDWLEDYVLFITLHEANPEITWNKWEEAIAKRDPQALQQKREELADQKSATSG